MWKGLLGYTFFAIFTVFKSTMKVFPLIFIYIMNLITWHCLSNFKHRHCKSFTLLGGIRKKFSLANLSTFNKKLYANWSEDKRIPVNSIHKSWIDFLQGLFTSWNNAHQNWINLFTLNLNPQFGHIQRCLKPVWS